MSENRSDSGTAPGRRRVILGGALVAASGLMFALAGMGIKMAEESLSSFEVLFWRNVLSLAILTPWVLWHWPRLVAPGPSRPDGDARPWRWWRRCSATTTR